MKTNLNTITQVSISLTIFITLLVVARPILVPMVFAILLALGLAPFCNYLERWRLSRTVAILVCFLSIFLVVGTGIALSSWIFVNIFQELPQIQGKLLEGAGNLLNFLDQYLGLSEASVKSRLEENASNILSPIWSFLENSISSSLLAVGNIFLTFIYIFFLLLYRASIKSLLLYQFNDEAKQRRLELLLNIQDVVKAYVYGLGIVIVMLGIFNSLGLWLIGIDYSVFWGFLAACLIIIPYVGTTLGGTFPFLYALATTNTFWQPTAVVILYFSIQQIEGNFITPNIVGNKINVNPLIAIFSMLVGGFIWGIAGLILALPLVGILRTVLMHYEASRPFGMVLSSKLEHTN
ncbi:MAG: AI-2E family transporter [Saprospiraceae bacterium]|nr:AI-2E family transporter [Saprospiraceae bacterium]